MSPGSETASDPVFSEAHSPATKEPPIPSNEQIIRNFYKVAEEDIPSFVSLFTDDGYFYDVSGGVKYYGNDITAAALVMATAFPDIHREIHELYVSGDVVSVELSLNGTHKSPLQLPMGTIPATGKTMQTPCSDISHLKDGKVQSFHCYSAVTIMLGQLGLLGRPNVGSK